MFSEIVTHVTCHTCHMSYVTCHTCHTCLYASYFGAVVSGILLTKCRDEY